MDYNLPMIVASGQLHHWEERDGLYVLVNGRDAFFATEDELVAGDADAFHEFFDAKRNYRRVREMVLASDDLRDLEPYLSLRILRQTPWEATVGFILSANNNLLRIRRTVLGLAEGYGDLLGSVEGLDAYSLPEPERMATLSADELRALGTGYRDRYLIGAAKMIAEGQFDLEAAHNLPYEEAKRYLMHLPGVGKKVADCILLFGYGRLDAFPVDVWIEKAMARFGNFPSREAMSDYGMARFQGDAGYIQQLLFMNEREEKK